MRTASEPGGTLESGGFPVWLGVCVFLAIAAFFLWEEHRAHLLGALPYALLLLCPVIHLVMHRGHGRQALHDDHVDRTGGNGRTS